MDRPRARIPGHSRQTSEVSNSTGSLSPNMSPSHGRSSLAAGPGGVSVIKRTTNTAARVAAARMAQVMKKTVADVDDNVEEDDDVGPVLPPARRGAADYRANPRRMMSNANGRGATAARNAQATAAGGGGGAGVAASLGSSGCAPAGLGSKFVEDTTEIQLPLVRTTQVEPPSRVKTPYPTPTIRPPSNSPRDRFPPSRLINSIETKPEASSLKLQDQLEMLQEENENILDKLHLAEERCQAAEARAQELAKQVAQLGEGVSFEVRHLKRKEEMLRQKEDALKAAAQVKDGREKEIMSLRLELDSAKEEVANVMEELRKAESETRNLYSVTQRMVLTQEEMEEVVLKRCWLARYWGLALRFGVYPDIALSKHEHWSSLASLPFEIVHSAGQKAREGHQHGDDNGSERMNKLLRDLTDVTGEGNIENMLSVEKGLRELASLKVEDAVVISMASHRRQNLVQQFFSDLKNPGDPKFMEAFELSQEECEDVFFKQDWLTYFWRRAKDHGVEEDIAEERLQFWTARVGQTQTPSSHDAVDVERGLIELRKLGIEQELWETSRKELDQSSLTGNRKSFIDLETSST